MIPKKIVLMVIILALVGYNIICISEAQQEKEQEKISPTLEQAIGQFKHENYEEALPLLKKARKEEPQSTVAAYYLGLTYKQLQNYKEAIPHLRDAVTFLPKIKGALIELVDCLYQTGQLEEANKWIKEAEKEGIRPAQVSFLKGLSLLKEENATDAIAAFENAKALDASMTQACDYQIGIAHLKERKFSEAEKAFKEVILLDPQSNMANFANEYMDAIEKRKEAMKPLKLSVGFAFQHDDNVVLKPDDASLATNITDESDYRYVYTAKGEYDKRFNDNFGVKFQDSFYYGKQDNMGYYNTLTNAATIQPNFYFKESMLSFPAGFTYTNVNDKSYLYSPTASAIYNHIVGTSNMAQLSLNYAYRDYRWAPSTADEDRDGSDLGGSLGWYWFFAKNNGFFNLRYSLNKNWSEGNNWEYLGNRGTATVLFPVTKKLNFVVTGDFFYQDFDNTHSVYGKKREDKVFTASPLLAYKFYKDWELQLQYTYVKDDSNLSVYEYTRNVYNAGIEIKF